MDDVMADATGQIINFYERDYGVRLTRQDLQNLHQREDALAAHREKIRKYPFEKGFFRTLLPLQDSQQVMEALNLKYEVFIVSAAVEFPLSLHEKLEWLEEHFAFLHWKQFVFCGNKAVVHGDIMIDDLGRNLDSFTGQKILFTAPHNHHVRQNGYTRVDSWLQVASHLL